MKKGFTLIELLAVIVILAIIAIIATPIVLNIISDAKESATIRSAENYTKAIENAMADAQLKNMQLTNGSYDIMKNGNICVGTYSNQICAGIELKIESNGTKPESGWIWIKNGAIAYSNLTINGKDYPSIPYTDENCFTYEQYDYSEELGYITDYKCTSDVLNVPPKLGNLDVTFENAYTRGSIAKGKTMFIYNSLKFYFNDNLKYNLQFIGYGDVGNISGTFSAFELNTNILDQYLEDYTAFSNYSDQAKTYVNNIVGYLYDLGYFKYGGIALRGQRDIEGTLFIKYKNNEFTYEPTCFDC